VRWPLERFNHRPDLNNAGVLHEYHWTGHIACEFRSRGSSERSSYDLTVAGRLVDAPTQRFVSSSVLRPAAH
jgi:hypothetical protein